jgi:hypothetical protein
MWHPAVQHVPRRALGQRRINSQPGPVPPTITDQAVTLPAEVAIQRPQRDPQIARRRNGAVAAGLAPERNHDRTRSIKADFRCLSSA